MITGLTHGASLMPLEGWDEDNHLGVAVHLDQEGAMPRPTDTMPRSLWPFLQRHPHPDMAASAFHGLHLRNYQGLLYDPATSAWRSPGEVAPGPTTPPKLYQAQHGPLFYRLMVGLKQALGLHRYETFADAGRVLGAICSGLMAVCWLFILRRLLRPAGLSWLAAPALLLLVANALFIFNHARFSNDALANLLATVTLLTWVVHRTRDSQRTSLAEELAAAGLVGALAGLAVLAKATAMVMLPLFGLGLAVRHVPWRRPGRFIGSAALLLAGYLALAGPYHADSLKRHGTITAMQEAVKNRQAGRHWRDLLNSAASIPLDQPIAKFLTHTIYVGGYSFHPLPAGTRAAWQLLLGLDGLLLLACLFRRRSRRWLGAFLRQAWELPGLVLLTWAGLFYHMAHSRLSYGWVSTNPWYAVIAFPALFCLLLLPAAALFARPSPEHRVDHDQGRARLAVAATAGLILVLFLTAHWLGMRSLEELMTNHGRVALADHHTLLALSPGVLWVMQGTGAILMVALAGMAWSRLRSPS